MVLEIRVNCVRGRRQMFSQIVVLGLVDNIVLIGQVAFLDSQHVDGISALFFGLWGNVGRIVSNALRTVYVVYRRVICSHRTLKRPRSVRW